MARYDHRSVVHVPRGPPLHVVIRHLQVRWTIVAVRTSTPSCPIVWPIGDEACPSSNLLIWEVKYYLFKLDPNLHGWWFLIDF